jgi:hypothetical protein
MKTRLIFLTLLGTGLACGFTIDWWTADGGGGTSSGGNYVLSGTMAQPDAGAMSGGRYAIEGGYWNGPEILPSPGGPALTVTRAGADFTLAWPDPSPGWLLEKSGDLINWTLVSTAPVISGGYKTVAVPSAPGREFYRLRYP